MEIEKTELSEIEKAELVIKEAEQKKFNEFNEKITQLCNEYGFILKVNSQIVVDKK